MFLFVIVALGVAAGILMTKHIDALAKLGLFGIKAAFGFVMGIAIFWVAAHLPKDVIYNWVGLLIILVFLCGTILRLFPAKLLDPIVNSSKNSATR